MSPSLSITVLWERRMGVSRQVRQKERKKEKKRTVHIRKKGTLPTAEERMKYG
jgi:hypothetical protein